MARYVKKEDYDISNVNLTYHVYAHVSKTTNKFYVGITSKALKLRWNEHKKESNITKKKWTFHRAIAKHGPDDFLHFHLCTVRGLESASECENYWIEKLESYTNGYNMTTGGTGYRKYGDITNEKLIEHAIQYCIDNDYKWAVNLWNRYCKQNNLPIDYTGRFDDTMYFGFRSAVNDELLARNLKEPGYKLVSTMHTHEEVIDHAVKCFIENNYTWTRPLWQQYSTRFNIQIQYRKNGIDVGIVEFYEDLTNEIVKRGIKEPGYKVSITMHTEESMIEHGIKFFIENNYFWASDKWREYQQRFNMPCLTSKYYNGGYQVFKKIIQQELIDRNIVHKNYKIEKFDHDERDILNYAADQYEMDNRFDRVKWIKFCNELNIPSCYICKLGIKGITGIGNAYIKFESDLLEIVKQRNLPTIFGCLIYKDLSTKYWIHNDFLEECHHVYYDDPRLYEPGWELNKKSYNLSNQHWFYNRDTLEVIRLQTPDAVVQYSGNWVKGNHMSMRKYAKSKGIDQFDKN